MQNAILCNRSALCIFITNAAFGQVLLQKSTPAHPSNTLSDKGSQTGMRKATK